MKVLVTSPMRTGSTWVYELLVLLLQPVHAGFVSTVSEAVRLLNSHPTCVLKSHSLIDVDLRPLRGLLCTIRILRNYKDSLISRALYCRNVRRAEGQPNEPTEDEAIDACIGLNDRQFVNVFLSQCPRVITWMEDLVVYERGVFDYTFYYEMLLHNPRDQFSHWLASVGAEGVIVDRLDEVLDYCSFANMRSRKTPGFIGSTGVGQWMYWLDAPVWRALDALYLQQRQIAGQFPDHRRPITRPGR